jgi:hypothetical protein
MASPVKCGYCKKRGHKTTICELRSFTAFPAHAFVIHILEKFEEFGRLLRKRVQSGAVNPTDMDRIAVGLVDNYRGDLAEWTLLRNENLKKKPFVAPKLAVVRVNALTQLMRTGLTVVEEQKKKEEEEEKKEESEEEEADDDDDV